MSGDNNIPLKTVSSYHHQSDSQPWLNMLKAALNEIVLELFSPLQTNSSYCACMVTP